MLITHIHARAAGDGTSLAVEAARSAAAGGVGGRRGDCRLRGRGRHALFADHLAAHSEEAAVTDWSSCVVKVALCQLCKLGGQWAMSNTVIPPPLHYVGLSAVVLEQPAAFHKRVKACQENCVLGVR